MHLMNTSPSRTDSLLSPHHLFSSLYILTVLDWVKIEISWKKTQTRQDLLANHPLVNVVLLDLTKYCQFRWLRVSWKIEPLQKERTQQGLTKIVISLRANIYNNARRIKQSIAVTTHCELGNLGGKGNFSLAAIRRANKYNRIDEKGPQAGAHSPK